VASGIAPIYETAVYWWATISSSMLGS
jgi:hypothetical protein